MQTIDLVEYETRIVRTTGAPTVADRELADRLTTSGDIEARLDVQWLVDGRLYLRATSWVGVVRFSAVEIRVMPKLVGGALQVLQMIEYSDGVSLTSHLPPDHQLAATGTDLFELVVRALIAEAKLLIRDGLLRDYRPCDDVLTVLRGRLRMRDQFLKRYGTLHRLECSFDEYDGDIAENQLLAAALAVCGSRLASIPLRQDIRALAGVLAEVCQPHSVDPDWYRSRIHYGRRNMQYRNAHELALLILQGLALNDLHSTAERGVNAFMINMNAIFERFVSELVKNSLAGTSLSSTTQLSVKAVIIDESTNHSYSSLRPDLVITEVLSGRAVSVDIKYKLYDATKFGSGDIYQLFTYAYALGGDAADRIAGVIYAASTATAGPALRIKPVAGIASARIRGSGIDVHSVLQLLADGASDYVHALVRNAIHDITGLAI